MRARSPIAFLALVAVCATVIGILPAGAFHLPMTWRLRDTLTQGDPDYFPEDPPQYGNGHFDTAVAGDWDNAGPPGDSMGVARVEPDNHWAWLLANFIGEGAPSIPEFEYGNVTLDWPVVGDWNGDGEDTIGLARAHASGAVQWLLRNTNDAGAPDVTFFYGNWTVGDWPVVGDWNGDSFDTIGVARPGSLSRINWLLRNSNTPGAPNAGNFLYGNFAHRDMPMPGDWDDDGDDTVGVVRDARETHNWYLRNTNSAGAIEIRVGFGNPAINDVPLKGDWDGDGDDALGAVRNTRPSRRQQENSRFV